MDIRVADLADAAEICAVVVRSLRQSDAQDYHPDYIEELVASFSLAGMLERMRGRTTFVASLEGVVVGTAALGDARVHTVFIHPDHQGRGIGAALMAEVEALACDRAVPTLTVHSSIAADGFYQRLGYRAVGEERYGAGRTIIMTKTLDVA